MDNGDENTNEFNINDLSPDVIANLTGIINMLTYEVRVSKNKSYGDIRKTVVIGTLDDAAQKAEEIWRELRHIWGSQNAFVAAMTSEDGHYDPVMVTVYSVIKERYVGCVNMSDGKFYKYADFIVAGDKTVNDDNDE